MAIDVDKLRKDFGAVQLRIWELTGNEFVYNVLDLVENLLEDY